MTCRGFGRLRAGILLASILATALSAPPAHAVSPARGVSPRRAFFMSLVVPGWGQYAAGHTRRAAVYGAIEASGWLSVGGMRRYESIYTDDYRALAASVAGANVDGQPRTYFDDLAFYETRTLHNQVARVDEQPEPDLYGVEDDWQWPTTADRQRFRDVYNDAKMMDRNVSYALLAVTLNHIASAIDAAKLASRARRGTSARNGSGTQFGFAASHNGGRLVCSVPLVGGGSP